MIAVRTLPEVPWRHADGLNAVIEALRMDDAPPRIVGGAVRDSLLGLDVSDVDLATPLLPKEVINRLERAGIKAVPTGLDHGTVTAVSQGRTYEITTLRRDVSTDGRRATVAFSTDWREDAQRRDFTINALYANPDSGAIFDYFDGLVDLQTRHIRFIGDARERIAEDHLRILRYFRFYARFSTGEPDALALHACADAAKSLMALSRERIASELIKILSLPAPQRAVSLMIEHGIFAAFLPELDGDAAEKLNRLIAREDRVSITARLLTLLPADPAIVEKVAMRLKLSNKMRSDCAARLSEQHPDHLNIRRVAYQHGLDSARDSALLFAEEAELLGCFSQLDGWEPPIFPIKGGDLIKQGLRAGPVVAKTLKQIEQMWIATNFPMDAVLNTLVDQQVAGALLEARNV
jgi:poly(A) polymerase